MKNILALLLLLPALVFGGTTYYVSSGGNDMNDGKSAQTAWKTIERVNTVNLLPGDKVLFNGGDSFIGKVTIKNSGTSSNIITISSYGTGYPRILSGDSSGIQLLNCEYVKVSGLHLIGKGIDTLHRRGATDTVPDPLLHQSDWHGVVATSTALGGERLRGIIIEKNKIEGYRTGILIEANSNNGRGLQFAWRGYDSLQIVENEIFLNSTGIFTWAQPYLPRMIEEDSARYPTGYYPVIGVYSVGEEVMYSIHQNFYIARNFVHDIYGYNHTDYLYARSGAGIRVCNLKNSIIESNHVTRCGHMGSEYQIPSVLNDNIRQQPANMEAEICYGLLWQFNESSFCKGMPNGKLDMSGADVFDGWVHNSTFQYNYIHNNDGYGIGIGGFENLGNTNTNAIIRFNVFVNNNRKKQFGDVWWNGPQKGLYFHNNLVYNDGLTNVPVGIINTVENGVFANNIFWSPNKHISLTSNPKPLFIGNIYAGGGIIAEETPTLASFRLSGQEQSQGVEYGSIEQPVIENPGATPQMLPNLPVWMLEDYNYSLQSNSQVPVSVLEKLGIGSLPTVDFKQNTYQLANLRVGPIQAYNSVLPIKLLYFKQQCLGPKTTLQWKIAPGSKVREYIVEYSEAGSNWSAVATIHTTSETVQHTHTGAGLFRLKLIDYNNKMQVTETLRSNCLSNGLKVFPTIISSEYYVTLNVEKDKKVIIKMFSSSGQLLKDIEKEAKAGYNLFQVSANNLPAGTYFINIENSVTTVIKR